MHAFRSEFACWARTPLARLSVALCSTTPSLPCWNFCDLSSRPSWPSGCCTL
ncbi:hypothetical protein L210DRAFT_3566222 [Boletus edulis BED1]|uniref:Uncharacterized protein n=1 Tax=Boletus edulis BED1 TaxID=1328754 RepID=A0AAD4BFL7_BOLED|nr:hypothetical protein L210DRAFT_3566222 [Boletus edulis BED1]